MEQIRTSSVRNYHSAALVAAWRHLRLDLYSPDMNFFSCLLCDENGVPDEANVAFLACIITLIIGAFCPRFPLGEFAAAVCALLPLYRASRGDWRGESSKPLLQKDQTQ